MTLVEKVMSNRSFQNLLKGRTEEEVKDLVAWMEQNLTGLANLDTVIQDMSATSESFDRLTSTLEYLLSNEEGVASWQEKN